MVIAGNIFVIAFHIYEGRSWTKCSTRRFVMAFRRFVMSFRRFGTPISEIGSANYQYDSSAGLFCHFVMSFHRFVLSFRRFVVSTRPLREALIRRTLHEVFT